MFSSCLVFFFFVSPLDSLATEFAEHRLTVDMYLGPSALVHQQLNIAAVGDVHTSFLDLPSFRALAEKTGGQVNLYSNFTAATCGEALANDVFKACVRESYSDCVMALRSSRGLRLSAVYGHFHRTTPGEINIPHVSI